MDAPIARHSPDAASAPVDRALCRRLLQTLLRTDSDLDAFYLDFFPEIHSLLTRGMDVTTMHNLLLARVEPSRVLTRLRERFAEDPSALATLEHFLSVPRSEAERLARAQWQELEDLCTRREAILLQGGNTADIDKELVELKRRQRQGAQISPGLVLKDRYRLIEQVGRGGFARVWRAFDRVSQQSVAVKILHSRPGDIQRRSERFQRGARQMQGLSHPNIVRVLDSPGEHDGWHFFVMELLSGGDLHSAVLEGRVTREAALQAVLQVGDALEYAHQRGLIHRDVKPQNILLDGQGRGRLTDFDLVWASDTTGGTRTGAMGTFLYSAPEEMEDASRVDGRADIFALAMTTVFVLHNKALSRKVLDSRAQILDALSCPPGVKRLLLRATDPDPQARPATVREYCTELAAQFHKDSVSASGVSTPTTAPASRGKRRWPLALALGTLGLLLAVAAGLGWRRLSPQSGAAAAAAAAEDASSKSALDFGMKEALERLPETGVSRIAPAPTEPPVTVDKNASQRLQADRAPARSSDTPSAKRTPERQRDGYLVLDSRPRAQIIIDSLFIGKRTPVSSRERIALRPGRHDVSLVVNQKAYTFIIDIPEDQEIRIRKTLLESGLDKTDPDPGFLTVRSKPRAEVQIDGWRTGMKTPLTSRNRLALEPGTHSVVLKIGSRSFASNIQITSGREMSLVKDLSERIKKSLANEAWDKAQDKSQDKEQVDKLLSDARDLAKTNPERAQMLCRRVMAAFGNDPKDPKVQEAFRIYNALQPRPDEYRTPADDDDF